MLGDTKYLLFRNISFLCLGCWLIMGLPGRIRATAEIVRMSGEERRSAFRQSFSPMDFAVASYGVCVTLSALATSYGRLAWVGYEGWFMGAISQLLFAGVYFFLSRQYNGAGWPLYLGELAFLGVTVFGLLHRLGIDPLGLHKWWNSGDWEYSHMLSTLGNINWLCGFYSVVLAFPVIHFLREERLWMQIFSYIVTVSAFVLLGIQGSQGGLLILGVCAVLCIFLGKNRPRMLRKIFLLWTGFFLCMSLTGQAIKMRGEKAAMAADGNIFAVTKWYYWVGGAVLCGALAFFFGAKRRKHAEEKSREAGIREPRVGTRESRAGTQEPGARTRESQVGIREARTGTREPQAGTRGSGDRRPRALAVILLLGVLTVVIITAFLWFLGRVEDSFGSGRGLLWRIAVESFKQAGWKEKLIGAGPDCYAEAVFNKLGWASDVWAGEHWEFAVFTNAHNEILNQLCNTGILGTVSYLAIFLVGFWRYGSCQGSHGSYGSSHGSNEVSPESREGSYGSYGGSHGGSGGSRRSYGVSPESRGDSDGCCGNRRGKKHLEDAVPGTWVGVLALAMYGAHSLISFQQVLNTPLLFLVLGLCEHEMRVRSGTAQSQFR